MPCLRLRNSGEQISARSSFSRVLGLLAKRACQGHLYDKDLFGESEERYACVVHVGQGEGLCGMG